MCQLKFRWIFSLLFFIDLPGIDKGPQVIKTLRDPFNLPINKNCKKNLNISLLGIVYGASSYGAIFKVGDQVDTFFLNDKIQGFEVFKIDSNYVILSKGKNKKKFLIE